MKKNVDSVAWQLRLGMAGEEVVVVAGASVWGIIFILLWLFCGLIPFIWSLICFKKTRMGDTSWRVLGLILAIFLGPFYWILFFIHPDDYCRLKTDPARQRSSTTSSVGSSSSSRKSWGGKSSRRSWGSRSMMRRRADSGGRV
jgi:hypothetical protein